MPALAALLLIASLLRAAPAGAQEPDEVAHFKTILDGPWFQEALASSMVLIEARHEEPWHEKWAKGRGHMGAGALWAIGGWTIFAVHYGSLVSDCPEGATCDGSVYAVLGLAIAIPGTIALLIGPFVLGAGVRERREALEMRQGNAHTVTLALSPGGLALHW